MHIKEYLKNKIDGSWYKNVKIDYGINGHFDDVETHEGTLMIIWTEEGVKQALNICYYEEYTLEQLYNIWMECDRHEVIILNKEGVKHG